ncbi:MAG: hypothetical protein NTZ46_00185 [Verrucomicrobia bacterium]|nr:hypothetical protein [Verrucomicrobiota bacterium]
MRLFFQSPMGWFALFCAALSAGLWDWSRRLPECHWETSASASGVIESVPASSPEPALENSPGETTPAVVEISTASPTPAPVASATPKAELPAAPRPTPPPVLDATGPLPKNPEPTASAAQPTPSPAASLIPPAPLDLAEIARQPELWPPQVVLLASVRFPVILKGVNVGNIQMPPGRAVLLRKVNVDGTVEIELQGSQTAHAKVQAQTTDILVRAQALAAGRKSAAPAP